MRGRLLGRREPRTETLAEDAVDLRPRPGQPGRVATGAALGALAERIAAVERGQQRRHTVAGGGGRQQDVRTFGPRSARLGRGAVVLGADRQHRSQLGGGALGARTVALVDDDDVGDLQEARP